MTLSEEVDILVAKMTIRNARAWLAHQRGETVAAPFDRLHPPAPPPFPPNSHEVDRAEKILVAYGIEP